MPTTATMNVLSRRYDESGSLRSGIVSETDKSGTNYTAVLTLARRGFRSGWSLHSVHELCVAAGVLGFWRSVCAPIPVIQLCVWRKFYVNVCPKGLENRPRTSYILCRQNPGPSRRIAKVEL